MNDSMNEGRALVARLNQRHMAALVTVTKFAGCRLIRFRVGWDDSPYLG